MARRTPITAAARFTSHEIATIDRWARERGATRADLVRLCLGAVRRERFIALRCRRHGISRDDFDRLATMSQEHRARFITLRRER